MTRRRFLLALVVVLLAASVSTTLWARAGARPDHCRHAAARAEERAALVTGEGREVLVIGDSYSVGAGLRPRASWPTRLPGRVRVDGFSGSGFSRGASPCGDQSFATRAARSVPSGPDLVVVEGGLNDHDQPTDDLEAGFERLLRVLEGTAVVVVGPPSAPARPRAQVLRVDAALARLSAAHGVRYVSMVDVELTYLDDRLHPDAAGHRAFGDHVARAIGG